MFSIVDGVMHYLGELGADWLRGDWAKYLEILKDFHTYPTRIAIYRLPK